MQRNGWAGWPISKGMDIGCMEGGTGSAEQLIQAQAPGSAPASAPAAKEQAWVSKAKACHLYR